MISILIPAYNFDVTNLVNTLFNQAVASKKEYEIIVLDDNSDESFKTKNRGIDKLEGVHYFELEKNIGRSGIRNRLADMAKYSYLLFMDCDAEILYNDYLANYLAICKDEIVACGGWIYSPVAPRADRHRLRWKYGFVRESQDARERKRFPYSYFMTNNFLISKSIIQKHGFNEELKGYGHEDTLFALELRRNKIPVTHIDNPMIHLGLESNTVFLEKTRHRVRNLMKLLNMLEYQQDLEKHSSIVKALNKLERWKMLAFYCCFSSKFNNLMIHNLTGKYPSLLVFDMYKLGFLCQIYRKKKIALADL
jgi:glycosyltransferase involved in cell wall biosynthesis